MYSRLAFGIASLPLLAQAGCSEQDTVNILMVVVQTLVTSLVPVLISALLSGAAG